jgi:hypothetical protein
MVFERRPEVRVAICTALRRLCVQNKLVLKAQGQEVRHATSVSRSAPVMPANSSYCSANPCMHQALMTIHLRC